MSSTVQSAVATATVMHDIEKGKEQVLANDDDTGKEKNGMFAQLGLVTLLALGLGVASIVFNLLSMIFVSSPVTIVAGVVALVVALVVMKRQVEMDDKGYGLVVGVDGVNPKI